MRSSASRRSNPRECLEDEMAHQSGVLAPAEGDDPWTVVSGVLVALYQAIENAFDLLRELITDDRGAVENGGRFTH